MDTRKTYTIKLKNNPVLTFCLETSPEGEEKVLWAGWENLDIERAPYALRGRSEKDLLKWVKRRRAPKFRKNIEKLQEKAEAKNLVDYLRVTSGISASDCYWVELEGDGGRFEEVSFYLREIGGREAWLALVGEDPGPLEGECRESGEETEWGTELGTNGLAPKAWRRGIDGRLELWKADVDGNNVAAEYLAYRIARRLGVDVAQYRVDRWNHPGLAKPGAKGRAVTASVSRNFTNEGVMLECPGEMHIWGNLEEWGEGVKALLGSEGCLQFADMVVFDCLTCNYDRHQMNWGFLRDTESGEIVGLAPLYDMNLAFEGESLYGNAVVGGTKGVGSYFPADKALNLYASERHMGWATVALEVVKESTSELKETFGEGIEGWLYQVRDKLEENEDLWESACKGNSLGPRGGTPEGRVVEGLKKRGVIEAGRAGGNILKENETKAINALVAELSGVLKESEKVEAVEELKLNLAKLRTGEEKAIVIKLTLNQKPLIKAGLRETTKIKLETITVYPGNRKWMAGNRNNADLGKLPSKIRDVVRVLTEGGVTFLVVGKDGEIKEVIRGR